MQKNKFTFHVVALPHTVTSQEFNACAYTIKVRRFCQMMTNLGHEVYHYGGEGSDPLCKEHITTITNEDRSRFWGEDKNWKRQMFNIVWDSNIDYWRLANNRAIHEIKKRFREKDFLCIIGGVCQKPIANAFNGKMMAVEYGIGYYGTFSNYRVFESYGHMHYCYGDRKTALGRAYDVVIPNYFDPADFPFSKKKDDYYLFLGRLIENKGVNVAVEVTRDIGAKLILAGQGVKKIEGNTIYGDYVTLSGDHLEHVGYADVKKRGELMSRAKAVFMPTYYIEPFGGVNVEAQMCGTPVISSDWGAFPETVLHGITGYRCRTHEQYKWAARNVYKLKPKKIRKWAVSNYSIDRISMKYHEYFCMLYDLWESGYYQEKEREELDWLRTYY